MQKRNRKKYILLSLGLLLLSGASIVYYVYNKPAVDVQNASGTKIVAEELYKMYSTDTIAAKANYAGKILEVSGQVTEVSKNQRNQPIVLLKTNTGGAAVNCTIEQADINCKPGEKIVVKGICSGIGQGDKDLGILGDVYLVRCYLSK